MAAATDKETVIAIHKDEDWHAKLAECKNNGKLIVVDFTASWCGPCRFIGPHFNEYSKQFTDAVFLKVDVDECPNIASEWKVEAMPTFLFIKDGVMVDKMVGADKEQLKKKLTTHCATSAAPAAQAAQAAA